MPELLFERHDDIAVVTFNRPERRNAITPEMIVRLYDAWVAFREDERLRVAILTGAGQEAFSAGADLARLIPLLTKARPPEDDWDRRLLADPSIFQGAILRRFELYKPLIAAVNGTALAGATEMMQATDLRFAVPEATFGLSEPKRGLVPGGGSLVCLARQIRHHSDRALRGDDAATGGPPAGPRHPAYDRAPEPAGLGRLRAECLPRRVC